MISIAGEYLQIKIDGNIAWISRDTGEVTDFNGKPIYIQTVEERQQMREYFQTRSIQREEKNFIDCQYKEYGNFIWVIYTMLKQNFLNISNSSLTRLMFLSTYLGYKGYLLKPSNSYMDKKDMFDLLKLSVREFNRFYTEMFDNKILYDKNNCIYLNKDIFARGKISAKRVGKIYQQERMITRIYIKSIRELYRKAIPRSHKTLGYVFQVMPYVNKEYNVCCFNPLETNKKRIKSMNLGQFCDIIGYDKKNANRLKKLLLESKFTVDRHKESAMCYVIKDSLDQSTYGMFINPKVYYAGDKWNEIDILNIF